VLRKLKYRKRFLTVALLLTCWAGHALAQGNTADLQGVITDPSGGTVSGARVTLENPAVGLVRETTSRDGEYSFLSLPPARYAIRVDAKGFRSAVVSDLLLTVGQKAQLPIRLEISPLVEALNILVSNAEVETTRSSLATTIDQRAIENLPINGRSYIQFTLLDSATTRDNQPILAPAPTSGLNINGQRARANFVSIDGVDATDASVNGVRATLSQEAVQEFQILKSGYAPEYGRASSAVINIVSKQGPPGLNKTQNFADRFKQAVPLGFLFTQTFLPSPSEAIDPRSPIVLGDPPFGGDPASLLHAMKRRIERPLLDAQCVVRDLLNTRGDAVSMLWLTTQCLKNKKVECPLECIRLLHFS